MPPLGSHDINRDRARRILVSGAIVVDLLGRYSSDFVRLEWNTAPQCVAFDAMQSLTYLIESCGGCASNIAYNLALIGMSPMLASAVGADFPKSLFANLERVGVDLDGVKVWGAETLTPRSVTLTDRTGRQFSFWAANGIGPEQSQSIEAYCLQQPAELVVVASNLPTIMLSDLQTAATCHQTVLWAPGGDIAGLNREELLTAWTNSNYIVINETEWQTSQTIMGDDAPNWPEGLRAVVITKSARGSTIMQKEHEPLDVSAVTSDRITDPTGCGDAFVAGFVCGLISGFALQACAQLGSTVAAFNLESLGTQRHIVTSAQIADRLRETYGATISWC